jgi:excisionase family DNA binding protein
VDTLRSVDFVTIASRVCEALESPEPSLIASQPVGLTSNDAPEATSLEDLATQVGRLERELERVQWMQRQLEQQMLGLINQLQVLPACIMRLEQWSGEADRRLTSLDRVVDGGETALSSRKQWHSIKEVATQLGMSESTVRRYIREGKLPAVRLHGGRGIRLSWSDIVEQVSSLDLHDGGDEE